VLICSYIYLYVLIYTYICLYVLVCAYIYLYVLIYAYVYLYVIICVSDDLDSLHSYLDKLQQSCDSVSGWMTGGKIYLDYITIYDVVNDLRQVGYILAYPFNLTIYIFHILHA